MPAVRIAGGPEFSCAPDDTILRAGLRAGLGFPYECNSGACGTCKVELLEGEVASLRPDAPGLAERDRAKNRILACQARPLADCAIKVRLREENVPAHRPARFGARLSGFRDLTHDMREFTFATRGAPGFLPGQYALFYLPGLETPRTYSMSNVDDGRGEWQFVVRRVPGGVGTMALFDRLPVGAEITLDGPYGLAYLRPDSPRDIVCIGGGSGLAPMLSIARGAAREPKLAGRRLRLFYGARTQRDLCGAEEMAALAGYGTHITFEPVLSLVDEDAADPWSGPTGFVHEHVLRELGEGLSAYEFYFAGPPLMAEAVQRMLMDRKVSYTQVHFDSFY
jgi:toluene monooxygenase electron transfer component